MFSLAILIGIYSYLIFAIGLLGFLHKETILLATIIYFLILIYFFKNKIIEQFSSLKLISVNIKKYKLESILIILLVTQATVNLAGALGPELGFDALWYHLTLPKIYLLNHSIVHIPGGLLYYSDMPKLTEMLYTASLAFGRETWAKLIHFAFGIASCTALYLLSRKFFDRKIAIITVAIFYSNLVIGWQSITAYVDLTRTFFELMALWGFVNFFEKGEKKWLIESAVMLGLAVTTKLLSIGSIFIFILLITYYYGFYKKNRRILVSRIFVFVIMVVIIPLPWFIFSFIHTGNLIYPFFSNTYPISLDINLLNPINFLKEMWVFFTNLPDRISLLYLVFLPLIVLKFRRFNVLLKVILIYSIFSVVIWYFTPRTGGGRFIMPYLPAFSIILAGVINEYMKIKYFYKFLILLIIIYSVFSITYRGLANEKYLPVILGKETRVEFLEENLNFSFGDFYDTDGYLEKNIRPSDRVLLYGFHNLYYVNFPFIDSSWVKKGDTFNYIATQNTMLPKRFSYWSLIYKNEKTKVNLYSLGGQKWVY
ncbi:MAG: glycosyltransferase family 39 protein [Candidatus Levybacteria bacterium]|nr:glycosyltransferase family 39 protein [Candidatus Levybacteria bacterium]